MDRKLIFFEDTSDLALQSVFPTDKKSALCFMQLFCHRLNEVLERDGVDSVLEIIEYGNAIKKTDRSFENKSEYKGKKQVGGEPDTSLLSRSVILKGIPDPEADRANQADSHLDTEQEPSVRVNDENESPRAVKYRPESPSPELLE